MLVDLHPGYLVLCLKGTQASLADFARARFLVAGLGHWLRHTSVNDCAI